MTTSIDVLAVIDAAIKRLNDSIPVGEAWSGAQLDEEDDLREARAAVAELIEAAGSVSDATAENYGNAMGLHLALASTGGLNERLSAALARVKGAQP